MDGLSLSSKLCAVCVTYNTGRRFLTSFDALRPQVGKIFIVDNSSDADTISVLQELEAANKGTVDIVFNKANLGIAVAQNMGICRAMEQQFEWVLLMDDDSVPADNMTKEMLRYYDEVSDKKDIGILVPNVIDVNTKKIQSHLFYINRYVFSKRCLKKNQRCKNVLVAMASGSLIRTELFKRIGLMREEFFIDYVDSDFCLRTIGHNRKIVAVGNAWLYHELGRRKRVGFGVLRVIPTNHPAIRRYYIYRNRLLMLRKYALAFPGYALHDLRNAVYDILKIIFFEEHRCRKLLSICRGIKDALCWNGWKP